MATLMMEKDVDCRPDLAVSRIYRAFGAESTHEVTRRLTIPFEDLGLPKIGELARDVVMTLGDPDRKAFLTRIPLTWRVPDSTAFPVFQGFFEVQPLGSDRIQLAILGYYHPPLGMIGAVFDMVAGRKIAFATIRHLLDEIGKAIEDRAESARLHTVAS